MKILALDSSGLVAGVALLSQEGLLAEYNVNYKKTHSETLLPMIDAVLTMTEQKKEELTAIAVAAGPGSFTGLRIGSATAKGLGLALQIPIIEVPTVDALAWNMFGYTGRICPLMDARRSQVYTGLYTFDEKGIFQVLEEQRAADLAQVLEELNQENTPVAFLGDGVPVYEETIREKMKVPYVLAPAMAARQRAAGVGTLGLHYYLQGKHTVPAEDHKPIYLRLSQAERERLERE